MGALVLDVQLFPHHQGRSTPGKFQQFLDRWRQRKVAESAASYQFLPAWTAYESWHAQLRSGDAYPSFRFHLDSPQVGATFSAHTLHLAGWVHCRESAVTRIELCGPDGYSHRIKVDRQRLDVANFLNLPADEATLGFVADVCVVGTAPETEWVLNAVLTDDSRLPMGSLRFSRQRLQSAFEPRLQPLVLNSLGRSGSTWLMHLLANHPAIVVAGKYPYETRAAHYWLSMLRFCAAAHHADSITANDLRSAGLAWLAHDPRAHVPSDADALHNWFGSSYLENLASDLQQKIEDYYGIVASSLGRAKGRYFAEKIGPDRTSPGCVPWLAHDLYAESREIFLVRDFRDVFCSMRAFNAKRGYLSFDRDKVQSDEEYVRLLKGRVARLSHHWQQRCHKALLIRYEDLIRQPNSTLQAIFEYLNLDASPKLISNLLAKASSESPELRFHQTALEVDQSIGRWRADLEPALRALCEDALDPAKTWFNAIERKSA